MILYSQDEIVSDFNLPELPPEASGEDNDDKYLVLFHQDGDSVVFALVSGEDARCYAGRDDTHGDGWFVGTCNAAVNDYEIGEVYS